MLVITYLIIVLYSLIVSSFLNVVAIRLPKGESILFPSSHCVNCNHRLFFADLVPVISYIALGGRCRYCGVRISPLYIIGEIVTTSLITFTIWKTGFSSELWVAIPLVCFLATISIGDMLYQIIPDKLNAIIFIYFMVLRCFYHPLPFLDYMLGIAAGGGVLLLIAMISRGGMGGGDIKLMAGLGIALGWKLTLLSLFLSSLLGSIIGIMLLAIGVVKRGKPIAFGPFLGLGSWGAYMWGEDMIHWYLQTFL